MAGLWMPQVMLKQAGTQKDCAMRTRQGALVIPGKFPPRRMGTKMIPPQAQLGMRQQIRAVRRVSVVIRRTT